MRIAPDGLRAATLRSARRDSGSGATSRNPAGEAAVLPPASRLAVIGTTGAAAPDHPPE
jgi:hypothetical protein